MAVCLTKGANVSLSKEVPGLKKIVIGCGWDASSFGKDVDVDVSLILCNAENRVISDNDFIYFNNKTSKDGAVVHGGDSLTGEGSGDDESINVNLDIISKEIVKIPVIVTIYDAKNRNQNFGGINNAYIRIINGEDNKEIARYDLTEDYGTETSVIFGEVYLNNSNWKFKAVGQGSSEGLGQIAASYGVNI